MSFSNNNKPSCASPLNNTNNNNNKENKSPFITKTNTATTSSSKMLTPSSNEILNAAQRILNKRQSNNNLQKMSPNSPDILTVSNKNEDNAENGASFKDIKNKFENLINTKKQIQMTPKLIIKKFEDMSRDGQLLPLSGSIAPTSTHASTTNLSMSAPNNNVNRHSFKGSNNNKQSTVAANSNEQDHITPKSIINKFEMLLAKNNENQNHDVNANNTNNRQLIMSTKRTNCKELKTTTPSPSNSQCTVTASLTYVSSVVSSMSVSPSYQDNLDDFEDEDASDYEDEDINTKTVDNDDDQAIYEELNADTINVHNNNNNNGTSLFEDTREDSQSNESYSTTTNTQTFDTQETYSLSSDYTGSFVNQDEFTDVNDEDEGHEEEDYTYEDTATMSQINDVEDLTCTSYDCSQIDKKSPSQSEQTSLIETEPLFSIKEYRRQKRRNNGRRSSMMPRQSLLANNKDVPMSKVPVNKAKTTVASTNPAQTHAHDDQVKKAKFLERIRVNSK